MPEPDAANIGSALRFLPCGDAALTIEFGDSIDPAISARVLALDAALRAEAIPGLIETVPTYRSLNVQFDPLALDYAALMARAEAIAAAAKPQTATARRWRVPVVYGGAFGIDLDHVAGRHGIAPKRLIEIHSGAVYRCYMIGFMPGLAYLGGLDPSIATPRRDNPRLKTPPGSVSIGGIQALVASVEMPSGWHLLGRTPARAYMPGRDPVFLFEAGDEIVFEPVDASRWDGLDRAAEAGELIAGIIPR